MESKKELQKGNKIEGIYGHYLWIHRYRQPLSIYRGLVYKFSNKESL